MIVVRVTDDDDIEHPDAESAQRRQNNLVAGIESRRIPRACIEQQAVAACENQNRETVPDIEHNRP